MNLTDRSIEIIRAGQAPSGAYLACASFSQYGYSWLRDGTWIAHAMATASQPNSAEAFYRWAARTLLAHEAKIERLLAKLEHGETPAEIDYLPTRFTVDGAIGRDDWTEFQLDGYGAWLWGAAQFCAGRPALWSELRPAVALTVRYLAALWRAPNYDCWEEHREQIHTATLAAIYGGLTAVREIDTAIVTDGLPEQIRAYIFENCVSPDGHFMKFIGNSEVDASLLWVAVPYGVVDVNDARFQATLAKIERDIVRPGGGVYRYKADTYFGGGEWLLLTAWLGWVYAELGRISDARRMKAWVEAQVLPGGEMPEQVDANTLDSTFLQPWIDRWGESACPLLWSHAMWLILDERLKEAQS